MNNRSIHTTFFRTVITLGLLAVMATTGMASAVRPSVVSRGHTGEVLGGFIDISGPMGGRIYYSANFSDSSADGNIVVFTSTNPASEVDPNVVDTLFGNQSENVFLRNMRTGESRCVSCQLNQGVLKAWTGGAARITPDGRYVVYSGLNLNDPAPFITQIYRLDLVTGIFEQISKNPGGVQGNNHSTAPVISDDGRYVAFFSSANNLVDNYPAVSSVQVFVRDTQTNQTLLASHASGSISQPGNAGVSITQPISISANGRFAVWTSPASDHLPFTPDNNAVDDVYFFDVFSSGFNIGVASANTTGTATGNGASFGGLVSANSASFPPKIVFASNATNLNAADTNPGTDIYCYRGETTARLVSVARDGSAANAASSPVTSISRNARFVAFSTGASNLVTGTDEANNSTPDVFLRDLDANTTRYASLNAAGQPSATAGGAILGNQITAFLGKANGFLSRNVSEDGRYVAFLTAEALSVRDSSNVQDVYVRDMTAGVSILASLNRNLTGGENGGTPNTTVIALAAGGRKVTFPSFATNLAAGDNTSLLNSKVYQANISLLSVRSASDVDGDGKNDLSVFRPADGIWYSLSGPDNSVFAAVPLGESGVRIAPGDYDGDASSDQAVFNPANGRWDVLLSSDQNVVSTFFGAATDALAPADFDGDGRTDLAYFRPSNGTWYIMQSNTNSLRTVKFGLNGDIPVAGDYDGDNRADVAVFRPANGDWYLIQSTTNSATGLHWGATGDRPVVGDYDGDGKSDAAVFRNGIWYILKSRDGSVLAQPWGLSDDRLVVSDYDGDGRSDVAVFRPSNGTWYILASSSQTLMAQGWGVSGDLAVPAAYVP